MKRFGMLLTAFLCIVFIVQAQLSIPRQIVGGNRDFAMRIKNTGYTTATFFPKGTDVTAPYRHYSRQALTTHLMSLIPDSLLHTPIIDSAQVRLAILLAAVDLIKDYHRVNQDLFVNEALSDSISFIVACQYAGGLANTATYSQQCNNYWRELVILLVQTKWFTTDMVRNITLLGTHSLGEVFIKNWILVDADAGTPVAISKNPAAPCGYASLADIQNDTSLITERFMQRIYNGERVASAKWYSLSTYRHMFSRTINATVTDSDFYWLQPAMSINKTTEIILPPGAEISMEYHTPWYTIDTSTLSGCQTVACMLQNKYLYANSLNEKYLQAKKDTLYGYMGKVIPLDSFTICDAMKYPLPNQSSVHKAKLTVPAQAKEVLLKLPWYICKVQASNPIYYNGMQVKSASYQLWHQYAYAFRTLHSDINYADSVIIPAGVSVEMELAYNPTYFDWWRGFEIEPLGKKSILQITANGITSPPVELKPSKLKNKNLQ